MTLAGAIVKQSAAAGTVIGTFAVSGVTGSPTFTLVDSAGGKYAISGNSLEVGTTALVAETDTITVAISGVTPAVADQHFNIGVFAAAVLSAAAGSPLTTTTASISVSTTEDTGTLYWVVTGSATAPSAAQIEAGEDNTGAAAIAAGSASVTATGVQSFNAAGLTPGTTVFAHFVQTDVAGNVSNVANSASFQQLEAPTNSAVPTIIGTAQVGQTLTYHAGTWAGVPTPSIAIQWSANGTPIGGAIGTTYVPVTADTGKTITVGEAASNSIGNATATSAPTSAVIPVTTSAPVNTVAPSISGTPQVGATLTGSAGTWTGTPTPTPTYQWDAAGVPISGATAITYVPVSGDVGKTITFIVTETNTAGFASATSAATAAVTAGAAISLSANQDIQGAAQNTAIGTISGGTGPYTVTDATNQTQIASGNLLQVGSVSPGVGSATITIHDTGTPAAADANFTINTVPQAPTLDLVTASDTGSSSTDNITNNNTPDLDINCPTLPVAGDVITLKDGATTIVTKTLASGDISSSTASLGLSALSDGVHSLTASHTRSSLASAFGAALSITIDTVAPVLSSPSATETGSTSASLSVATDTTSGTMAWFFDTTATAPADATAFATRRAAAPVSSSADAVSASPFSANVLAGLTASTTYYAYFLQTDVAGNVSNIAAAASITTASGAFSLASLALDALWSSTDSTFTFSSGTTIATVSDATGNGNSLTVSGVAPSIGDGHKTLNSKPVIDFAGSNGRLFTSSAFSLSGTPGSKTHCSILLIATCTTYTSAPRLIGMNVSGNDNTATGGSLIFSPDATELKVQNNGGVKADSGTGAMVAGTYAVIITTWDGTNNKLYVNGTLKSTVANAPTFADSFTSIDIGSAPNSGNALNGGVAIGGIVGRVFTSGEIAAIQTWAHDPSNWAI